MATSPLPTSADGTNQSPERLTPIDEHELRSGPGIAVLIAALAAYLAGILVARSGGVAEAWTAVALFVLGTGGLAGSPPSSPARGVSSSSSAATGARSARPACAG